MSGAEGPRFLLSLELPPMEAEARGTFLDLQLTALRRCAALADHAACG